MGNPLIAVILSSVFVLSGYSLASAKQDSCSLLTKEDVASVMGTSVKQMKLKESPQPNCEYKLDKGYVVVFLFNDAGSKASFENGRKMQDKKTEAVSGIADSAYWSPNPKILNILKKNSYVTIQFIMTGNNSLDTAKKLAAKAVTKIQ